MLFKILSSKGVILKSNFIAVVLQE